MMQLSLIKGSENEDDITGEHNRRIMRQADELFTVDKSITFVLPLPLSGIKSEIINVCVRPSIETVILIEQMEGRCKARRI